MSRVRRWVVECVWNRNGRACHRRALTYRPKHLEAVTCVKFTDGTYMTVEVRPAHPREKVETIAGYDTLLGEITSLGLTGHVTVDQVQAARDARTAKAAVAQAATS